MKRATPIGALFSIIIGWTIGLSSYIYFGESGGYTTYWAFVGIPLIFITGTFTSLITGRAKVLKHLS